MSTIKVMVDNWLLQDGSVRPLSIGDKVRLSLAFDEKISNSKDPRSSQITAEAIPFDGVRLADPSQSYRICLRFPSWEANWSAPRPVAGEVSLTGVFYADDSQQCSPVMGTVRRIQAVDGTLKFENNDWVYDSTAPVHLHDMPSTGLFFNEFFSDSAPEIGETRLNRMGVLIDLQI